MATQYRHTIIPRDQQVISPRLICSCALHSVKGHLDCRAKRRKPPKRVTIEHPLCQGASYVSVKEIANFFPATISIICEKKILSNNVGFRSTIACGGIKKQHQSTPLSRLNMLMLPRLLSLLVSNERKAPVCPTPSKLSDCPSNLCFAPCLGYQSSIVIEQGYSASPHTPS